MLNNIGRCSFSVMSNNGAQVVETGTDTQQIEERRVGTGH